MKDVWTTLYTREKGKQLFTKDEWLAFDKNSCTYHREDGPAVVFRSLEWSSWWIDNKQYDYEDEYEAVIAEAKSLPKVLKLTDPRWWVREMQQE